ncbi:ABC transporter ATP-binding protein [Murimonas intestini]|uniref:ATP-binding cassette subfamily B protein n=1 Tax=Murimonas intestini TaxID=1337051 RepID=A0AB73T4F6_9FIRM|nr:ABC transporter ATP-binding protein [Murimonas intestini]MCR1840980.1 ABC transporter ATP-binding protein/permease [Murimonas intestini]MCR1865902.1 ABC transporter ATP-binding protein/permease [Murimonas intestini]MCR1883322.1 ABC transporter ATP-binding protein/permease [Murimonas intestini]
MRYEEQEFTKSFDIKIWKKVLPFIMNFKGILFMVIALNLFCALADIALPLFQRYAIDNFIEEKTLSGLGVFAAAYAVVIGLQALSVIFFTRGSMKIEMRLGRDMKKACFEHLQTLSFSYYNVTPVGYILARVMNDTNKIAGLVAWNMVDMLWASSYVIGVFIAMLLLNWKLALIVMLIVPAIAVLTVYFQNRILNWNRKVRKINSRITSAYNEGIMGAKTSKTLVIEEKNAGEFQELTQEMRVAGVRAARLSAIYLPLVLFFSSLATAVVLAKGGNMVLDNLLMIGTLSAFSSYAVGIFEPIQQLARNLAEVISVQANIERVAGLLEEEPKITDTPEVIEKYGDSFEPKKENWEELKGDIEFKDVSFHYPDGNEEVLSHFNLKIPAGTTVAIVGETGAGKSTLVNLACRFFEPTGGQILIDGRDYRERSQLWLHSNIGYVLQNPHLFSGTVMDNIRYGNLEATDEQIIAAAKAVSADQVVEKLEKGYQSDVGEGGDMLSTGEKQLISFARAVLADPRIFVLDEATSSIDTQTEQLIQNATLQLLEGRTSFLIAHRLSTIRQADVILVVKDGRIIEQGTHKELLKKKGYYHDLYSKQFMEESAQRILA